MLHAAFLMPLFPLAGFVAILLVGRRLGDPWAGWIGTVAVAGSFVAACVTLAGLMDVPAAARHLTCAYSCGASVADHNFFNWITVGGLQVKAAILLDPLSMTMCMFVTGVSMLIHLYSIGYMKKDRDYSKFFLYLNLFVFSMLVLVLASNFLVTFVGWEGVGVCSYWLVAFWFHRESAASAGKKAFIYNRIGDVGFLLAMFLIFSKVGSLDYLTVFAHQGLLAGGAATAAVLLLFLAATGKSAQIPLFNWLPDAMEGPTPVSALIHAATMVTAGVYLLCRANALLALSPDARWVIAIIGGVTAFVAMTIACAQQDIKKVLAFSTVSQIGYMVLAVGCGAYVAAIFLMVCHAFYKGLLFLGAGSVIHGLEDEQDLKRMGALRKWLPWTFGTFLVGWLAIAGIPPFSGFWSKGDVLTNVFAKSPALYALGVLTALGTAYYMSRLFYLTFTGKARWQDPAPDGRPAHHAPHESPWVMRLPLVVLAVAAFLGGILDLPWVHGDTLVNWLQPVFGHTEFVNHEDTLEQWVLAVVDGVVALIGLTIAWVLWRERPGRTADQPALEPAFLRRVWYWDDVYDALIGRPGQAFARFCAVVVDGRIIDGAVNGAAALVRVTGTGVRKLQTGYVRNYALGIAVGLAAIIAFMVSRVWWS
ncbi:MAG TPA: NADH-quinone oxidoreductase subunit L [Acidimicrobiales bacterium]|nr:NADH-quinone oxidoreductase subunit L [Acidimicrobiales bacterium]